MESLQHRWTTGLFLLALLAPATPGERPPGPVVEKLIPEAAAARAGLHPGDVLLTWRRAPKPPASPDAAMGPLRAPLDAEEVELEQAPRGPVTLTVSRDGRTLTIDMPSGEWLLTARPALDPESLKTYQTALATIDTGDLTAGTATLLDIAERTDDPQTAASLLARVEDLWYAEKLWPHQERLDQLTAHRLKDQPGLLAVLAARRAVRFEWQTRWQESGQADDEALQLYERVAPDSLRAAAVLYHRAPIHRDAGEPDNYRAKMAKTLAMLEAQAPDSLPLARVTSRLARVGLIGANVEERVARARAALQMADRLAPESLDAASVASNLGILLMRAGELTETDALYQRALATRASLAPGSFEHGAALLNMGALRNHLGDLDTAAELLRQAAELTRRHRLGPSLSNVIASNQADVEEALGRPETARDLYRQALRSAEDVHAYDTGVAEALINVARVEFVLGDWQAAHSALERYRALAAKGVEMTRGVQAFGQRLASEMALARGDREAARQAAEQAFELDGLLAPGTAAEAEDLALLGRLASLDGRTNAALQLYESALQAVEDQRARGSADPTRSALFGARHFELYRAYIDMLVSAGRPADAFAVLERSRGRALRQQLTEREWARDGELPEPLAAERRAAESEYARVRAAFAQLASTAPPAERDALRERLIAQRLRLENVVAQVRRSDPRLFALQYPQALGLEQVRAGLDPGVLLLAYSIGDRESLVFAVQPAAVANGFAVRRLPVGRGELRRRVEAFRAVVALTGRQPAAERELRAQAAGLWELLLAPVWSEARGAQRLLISPDDALVGLPFAALRTGERYLAELKPTHTTISTTFYVHQRAARPAPRTGGQGSVVVFGDPLTPVGATASLRATPRSLSSLGRLPGAREEARLIAGVYPGALTYLGKEASEARARSLPRDTRLVHFACHAFADARSPMHSALVLSASGGSPNPEGDGLLEAWEILDHVRLDAELVTLSACQTALGTPVAGEGPMGLTRAFLHAGARSVVSSLWQVADESTQKLMARFYRELRAGQPKDEALRRAQAALVRGRFKAPFHWAGFQLQGDWR